MLPLKMLKEKWLNLIQKLYYLHMKLCPMSFLMAIEPFRQAVKTSINKVFNPNKPHKSTDILNQQIVDSFTRLAS